MHDYIRLDIRRTLLNTPSMIMFQMNDTNRGTHLVASGLDDMGYLGKIKGWKEPKDSNIDDSIGFWEPDTLCNEAM